MTLLALHASIGGAPTPPAEHPRDLGGKSAGGSDFAAIVSALDGEYPQPNARAAGTKGAASAQDTRASGGKSAAGAQDRAPLSESGPKSEEPNAIDGGLAGLVYSALASPAASAPSQFAPRDASAKSAAQQGASGSNSAAANALSAAEAARWRASGGRGVDGSADPTIGGSASAALTPAAEDMATANFALSGVVDQPQTIRMLANGESSLGVGAIRSRTYLGVDSAARSEARNPFWRSQARAVANATGPAGSAATGVRAAYYAAAASTQNETPPEKRSTSDHSESRAASLSDQSSGGGQAAINPSASSGVVNLGANPVTTGAGPIAVSQLPQRLAAEASALTATAAPTGPTPATGVASAQAVKELQIDLDPADLGAVSVKMRLTDGKLSVVMEVANPSTLKAIENERGAITDRLGSNAQSLETLVIKPTSANETSAESSNARDQKPGSQENAQDDPNRESRGNGQQPSRRDGAAAQQNPQTMARQPASRRGFGDLVV